MSVSPMQTSDTHHAVHKYTQYRITTNWYPSSDAVLITTTNMRETHESTSARANAIVTMALQTTRVVVFEAYIQNLVENVLPNRTLLVKMYIILVSIFRFNREDKSQSQFVPCDRRRKK